MVLKGWSTRASCRHPSLTASASASLAGRTSMGRNRGEPWSSFGISANDEMVRKPARSATGNSFNRKGTTPLDASAVTIPPHYPHRPAAGYATVLRPASSSRLRQKPSDLTTPKVAHGHNPRLGFRPGAGAARLPHTDRNRADSHQLREFRLGYGETATERQDESGRESGCGARPAAKVSVLVLVFALIRSSIRVVFRERISCSSAATRWRSRRSPATSFMVKRRVSRRHRRAISALRTVSTFPMTSSDV